MLRGSPSRRSWCSSTATTCRRTPLPSLRRAPRSRALTLTLTLTLILALTLTLTHPLPLPHHHPHPHPHPHQVTGKLFAKNAAAAFAGCFTFEDTTPDEADHKEFYLEKVELKQTGLATDKKKHYIHHLLRIFKDGGDATNSSPGWGKYEEQDEE